MKILKGIIKFLPVIILATLMIKEFDALIAAPIATIAALVIAIFMEKHSFKDCIDTAMKSVSNILIALFILMFAYAMASAFMTTGVGAAVVNIALSAGVTARSIAVVDICVTTILSVATGVNGEWEIHSFAQRDPKLIPWKSCNVDIVIESILLLV